MFRLWYAGMKSKDEYRLVGECYVHDITDGEVDDMRDMHKREIHLGCLEIRIKKKS